MGVLKFLLRRRLLVVVVHVAAALAMLPGMLQIETDNSPDIFFDRDAGALHQYEKFREDFGGGQSLRVALSGHGLWTRRGLAWLGQLEKQTIALPGVQTAVGLAAFYRWHMLEWPPPKPTIFRSQLVEKDLEFFSGLVSPDGNTITMLVVLADISPGEERRLLYQLNDLISQPPPDIRGCLSGLPVLHMAMDRSLVEMASRFLPILVFSAVLFLVIVFRRLWDVVVPLFFTFVCQSILFGILGYARVRLNLVTIILAPLLFVVTLATAVHLLMHFRALRQQRETGVDAVIETYRIKGLPVLWTGITTLTAFGSLALAGLPPLRTVGIWSALGIAIMMILAFTFYPFLLAGINDKQAKQAIRPFEIHARRLGRTWAGHSIRHRLLVIAAMSVTLVISLIGLLKLRVEDNIARYFPPHHPVRAELERLQYQGVGIYAAELVLSFKANPEDSEGSGFRNPWVQQRLARLSRKLRSDPLIYGALGAGDLVEATISSILVEGEVTDSVRWMALGLMQSIPESRSLLDSMISKDGQSARVTLLMPMISFNKARPLFQRVKSEAADIFPTAEIGITGQYPLILSAQRSLLRGLIEGFSVTLLCVVVVFLLLLRSFHFTFRVLLPNLWPIAVVFGVMGWFRLPLDSASVMTASIALGLAVDDTFHTLGHYLREVKKTDPSAAIEATLERTAPAHILTSIILAAGFAACSFSDLLPVSRLGSIAVAAIVLALAGDLLLIPALLSSRASIFSFPTRLKNRNINRKSRP